MEKEKRQRVVMPQMVICDDSSETPAKVSKVAEVGSLVDSNQADDRKLIKLVRERRLLYARNNMPVASYYTQVKSLWDDVAKEMGWSVADVRRKWSHIRNSYSRHLRNEIHGACTSKGRMVSRWYLADELEFLREHMATDIVNDKKKVRQQRYREQNREKLKQLEAERRKRKQQIIAEPSPSSNINKIESNNEETTDVNSQSLSGLDGTETSTAKNEQVEEKNALQKRGERQQRYRQQNREKLKQREAERRKRKQNSEIAAEPSTSSNIDRAEIISEPIIDNEKSRCSQVDGLVKTQDVLVETTERRPSPYSSYAPSFLEMDINDTSNPEPIDVKPFIHNPWFALNSIKSEPTKFEQKPPSIHNDDSSSSAAFGPDENSSYFQFFRGIYNDYQELSAKKQRLFKRKCFNLLHELLDEEETGSTQSTQGFLYNQNSALNLSNSGHESEDEKETKPNVEGYHILPHS